MKWISRVACTINRTDSVKSVRTVKPQNFYFKPGQFFKVFSGEKFRYLSASCSPAQKYLEFTKRLTQSDFSIWFNKLKAGDDIAIEGPYGRFTLENDEQKIAFIAGGIGITPIFSMLEDACINRNKRDYILFYGNRRSDDIPFYSELCNFSSSINLKIFFFVEEDGEEIKNLYHCGRLNFEKIKAALPDINERAILLCGPEKMVEMILQEIKNSGAVYKNIKTEKILGYTGG
ncbi:MAG: FAD-dependent oxidoreductase [Candidatus Omnitrophica bacterium]|nr:FAD-dependent oxidoreductase [Candidatus Omnitrophota bacterium]